MHPDNQECEIYSHQLYQLIQMKILEIKDSSKENLLTPQNLYACLFSTKAQSNDPEDFHLIDVGLSGTTKQELINGQAFFSTIKFKSTSYNHEGAKFHLVICLYIQNENDELPRILNSTISPPIYVDSRNSDPKNETNDKKVQQYVEPFSLELLEKQYIKRENKKRNDIDIQIESDLNGLYNYLSAPNIRNKVKHPIFLSTKFKDCVSLYFNKKYFKQEFQIEELNLEQIVIYLQENLIKDLILAKIAQPIQNNENPFILRILNYNHQPIEELNYRKAIDLLDGIQCPTLKLMHSTDVEVDQEVYKNINLQPQSLTNAYQSVLQKLQTIYQENKVVNNEDKSDEYSQDVLKQSKDFSQERQKSKNQLQQQQNYLNKHEEHLRKLLKDKEGQQKEQLTIADKYQKEISKKPEHKKQNLQDLSKQQIINQNVNFQQNIKQSGGKIVSGQQGNNTINNFQVQINQVKQQSQQQPQVINYPPGFIVGPQGHQTVPPSYQMVQMGQMQPGLYNQQMAQQQMMKQMQLQQQPSLIGQYSQGPQNQQYVIMQGQPQINPQMIGQQMVPITGMMVNPGVYQMQPQQMSQMQQPGQLPPGVQMMPVMNQHPSQSQQIQNKGNVKNEEK